MDDRDWNGVIPRESITMIAIVITAIVATTAVAATVLATTRDGYGRAPVRQR